MGVWEKMRKLRIVDLISSWFIVFKVSVRWEEFK